MSASCSGSQAVADLKPELVASQAWSRWAWLQGLADRMMVLGRKSGLVSVGLVRGSGFSGLVVARACGLGLVGRA